MLFQVFDNKPNRFSIYSNGTFYKNELPSGCNETWKYTKLLRDRTDVRYAKYWSNGKTLNELCPSNLKDKWSKSQAKMNAFFTSCKEVDLNLSDYWFDEIVPSYILEEFGELRNKICENTFKCLTPISTVGIISKLASVLEEIKQQKLQIVQNNLSKETKEKNKQFLLSIGLKSGYLKYNQFGTKTGRLSLSSDSFPVLNLKKELRQMITPQNDYFLELDHNASDLRTFLGLMDKEQPQMDLHIWNMQNVFKNVKDKTEAKRKMFSWFYNPQLSDPEMEKVYDRSYLEDKYFKNSLICSPYGDTVESTSFNWLNHLIQRTYANIFAEQSHKIWELLKDKKTKIALLMHDCILLDVSEQDNLSIPQLSKEYGSTRFGEFVVNTKTGPNWFEMSKCT